MQLRIAQTYIVKQAGEILDDELHCLLVEPLLPGVRLHCLIDACYSGRLPSVRVFSAYCLTGCLLSE